MRIALVVFVALGLSCGGSSGPATGTAAFSGSVRGQSLTPHDATASVLSFSANGVPGSAAFIAITSSSGLCSMLSGGKEPKSTRYLVLTAFQVQPNYSAAPPPAPGVYSVGALSIENAVALITATDASCQVVTPETVAATSGSITFTSVGNRYAGSFDLTFGLGDHVTGTFDAPVCAGLAGLSPGTGSLTCQ